jgi:hypothetical protein
VPYHIVVFTRRQLHAAARFLDTLSDVMIAHMLEVTQQVEANSAARKLIKREQVEVLKLDPLHDQFGKARKRYGPDAFLVLFLNDAARRACDVFGIDVAYRGELQQLPTNLGTAFRMDHYYE